MLLATAYIFSLEVFNNLKVSYMAFTFLIRVLFRRFLTIMPVVLATFAFQALFQLDPKVKQLALCNCQDIVVEFRCRNKRDTLSEAKYAFDVFLGLESDRLELVGLR